MHNQPGEQDDTVSDNLEHIVLDIDPDMVGDEFNLKNTVLQSASEELDQEQEAMASLEDDQFEDVLQETSNTEKETNTALKTMERIKKADDKSKAGLRKTIRQAEKINKNNEVRIANLVKENFKLKEKISTRNSKI